MASTATELAEARAALNSGTLLVSYSTPDGGSRSVTYRSLADLEKTVRRMESEQGARTVVRRGVARFTRGL